MKSLFKRKKSNEELMADKVLYEIAKAFYKANISKEKLPSDLSKKSFAYLVKEKSIRRIFSELLQEDERRISFHKEALSLSMDGSYNYLDFGIQLPYNRFFIMLLLSKKSKSKYADLPIESLVERLLKDILINDFGKHILFDIDTSLADIVQKLVPQGGLYADTWMAVYHKLIIIFKLNIIHSKNR